MQKNRIKIFIENFLVYGLGSILSKIAPLIMLPIVTKLMPDSFYYGLSDLSNMAVSFGSAIATMGMYDAMFRMFFDKDQLTYKKKVCSSTLAFVSFNSIILTMLVFLLKKYFSIFIFNSEEYMGLTNFTAICITISAIGGIMMAPTRMQNKRKIFLIINTISPIIGYCITIPMLLKGYYLYALPTSILATSILSLIAFTMLNHKWFNYKNIDLNLLKEMIKIGVPLMPSFILYWVFSNCDRVMISKQLGNDFVGIYGIGSRVASISQFIYTAFASGWQYFAFSTMRDKDQVELTTKIFEYIGLISFLSFMLIVPFSKFIFELFFNGSYVEGYTVFPYLFLAPLILMMYQTVSNQFLVIKKTWPSTIILLSGALLNVYLNYILINFFGIEGAGIATLAGYTVSIVIASVILHKMKLLFITKRMIIMVSLFLVFIVFWRCFSQNTVFPSIIMSGILTIFFLLMYKKDISAVFLKLKKTHG